MSALFTDFDAYVNGDWKVAHPIPDDQVHWGSFSILHEDNLVKLREICEHDDGLVGQLYQSMLTQPLQISDSTCVLLTKIRTQVTSHEGYWQTAAELLPLGISSLFHIYRSDDDKSPEWQVPWVVQSGLGLPRDYYFNREDLLGPYQEFIKNLTTLYGQEVDASAILEFERKKAQLHLTPAQARDNDVTYNQVDWTTVQSYCPIFFKEHNLHHTRTIGTEVAPQSYVLVQNLKLMEQLQELVSNTQVSTLRDLLVFQVCRHLTGSQTREILECYFDFYGRKVNGQSTMHPDWKLAVNCVETYLPDELGKLYVARHYCQTKEQLCHEMIELLHQAMHATLSQVDWWSEETRVAALKKLSTFKARIGAPSQYHSIEGLWPQGLPKHPADILLSYCQWNWYQQELAKMYTPTNQELWHMSPQTVNAYYNPAQNEIVFPAGILQEPFVYEESLVKTLGAIGVVIGHEMTHGFDDQGRKYDEKGVLNEWWKPEDCQEFDQRAKRVEEHYSGLQAFGHPINGKLTLGENIADIGGLKLALTALNLHCHQSVPTETYDTFFRAYANVWRLNIRPEYALKLLAVDQHSPASARINGALAHIDEFYATYSLTSDYPFYLPADKRMNIW